MLQVTAAFSDVQQKYNATYNFGLGKVQHLPDTPGSQHTAHSKSKVPTYLLSVVVNVIFILSVDVLL